MTQSGELMITEDLPPQELVEKLRALTRPKILVVGDVMVDQYTHGPVNRISQEAPVLVLRADEIDSRLGGAANVAAMIASLSATVSCAGAVGTDTNATKLEELLRERAIAPYLCADSSRVTTLKQRFVGRAAGRHPSQVLRVDHESSHELAQKIVQPWLKTLCVAMEDHDLVVISDYAKGVCTPQLVQELIRHAKHHNIPVLVDPGQGRPLSMYAGATLIKPNRAEAESLFGLPMKNWKQAQQTVAEFSDWPCEHLLITLDAEGLLLCPQDKSPHYLTTRPRSVYDITGAGDAVISAVAVAWAAGWTPVEAAWLGNLAGGIEVEHPGATPITREQLMAEMTCGQSPWATKVLSATDAATACRRRQATGERVVLTNGCFDLLHFGHVTYLQQARQQGDCLLVAINSDRSVRDIKGPTRPVIDQTQRAAMLAALTCVDYVVVFDEPTPHLLLQTIRPDLLVKGGNYSIDEVVGKEVVEEYGGTVSVLDLVDGISTTRIVETIQQATTGQQETAWKRLAG